MKKKYLYLGLLSVFSLFALSTTSCKTKEGCGLEAQYDPARSGKKSKKSKSGLLGKKRSKRAKKRGLMRGE